MSQSGGRWTTSRSVTFHSSAASRYYAPGGGSVGYMDDYGTFHAISSALYTGYTRAYLSFSDEQDSTYTLYDTTTISASGGTSSLETEEKWFLVQTDNVTAQFLDDGVDFELGNYAFDVD